MPVDQLTSVFSRQDLRAIREVSVHQEVNNYIDQMAICKVMPELTHLTLVVHYQSVLLG